MPPPAEGFAARFVVGPALRTQPDRRLVALVREGYENAFEEIVRRYGRPLTRYAGAIVGNRAEDVTQDAFSKALLALRRDGREIELRPWLFRIVRNTALNDLRDRPPAAGALAEAIAGGRDPEEELARREELTDLMERLGSLPETQRAAIVMRELEGLGHDEIAKALGLSGGAARQAIFRARQALRDGLGMLLPLPLLKGLLAGTAAAPVEAAGAAGIGGGAAGAGVALKTVTATVLVAGAVGAGVAIDHGRHGPHHAGGAAATEARQVADDQVPASSASRAGTGADATSGESHPGDDRAHDRGRSGNGHGSSGPGPPGGRGDAESGDHGGGGSGSSGSGGGESGRSSGSGSGGSGGSPGGSGGSSGPGGGESSGESGDSGSSGSAEGSGPDGDPSPPPAETATEPSSGSGGDSGSDGGGSDSSGSGSGSGSGSSPDGSGESSDSHGGDGLSVQTEPQS